MAKTATIRLDRQLRKLPLAAARPERVSRKGDSLFPYLVQVKSHRHPDVQIHTIGIADCKLDGGLAVWIAGSWLPADSKGTTVAGKCHLWYPKAEVVKIPNPDYVKQALAKGVAVSYIAGPMSGLSHHNKPAFWLAERILWLAKIRAESPANYPTTQSYAWYMREDLKKLLACDGVLFLKGWRESKGASLEHQVAEITGKVMIYES